jgi:hypothetical protein
MREHLAFEKYHAVIRQLPQIGYCEWLCSVVHLYCRVSRPAIEYLSSWQFL